MLAPQAWSGEPYLEARKNAKDIALPSPRSMESKSRSQCPEAHGESSRLRSLVYLGLWFTWVPGLPGSLAHSAYTELIVLNSLNMTPGPPSGEFRVREEAFANRGPVQFYFVNSC